MSEIFDLVAKLTLDKSEFDQGIDEAKDGAGGFGDALVTAGKIGAAAVAAIGTAVIGAGTAIVKATGEVAEYGDNIDKMSQKMGMSAQSYQEWDAVMQHSGTSMEAMKASMKTLANAAETGSEAFEKLGISQEELQNLSQEQLFERTISALQNVEDETQRTYLAGKTLGRGATELGALLNTSAEDTQAMRDRVRELGGVMSDDAVKAAAAYQDSLQDMNTAISSVKRGLMSEFLPSITKAMDGITEIFGGDGEKGVAQLSEGINGVLDTIDQTAPKFADKALRIVGLFGEAITGHLPALAAKGTDIVIGIATGIIEGLPEAAEAGAEIITSIAGSLMESLPVLVDFSETLREGAGQFVDVGIDFILNLAQGMMDSLPALIENLPQIVINIAGVINDNAPKLIVGGVKLIAMLVKGIISAVPSLIQNFPQIFQAILAVWSALNWLDLGRNVITWVKNGITNLQTQIPNALKDIGRKAIEFFKGINWSTAGSQAIHFITSAIRGLASLIPNALKAIGQTAVSAFKSINWLDLGANIIRGIVNGISSNVGAIVDAAKNAAKRAFDAAKDFLGIKSPSRLFRDAVGAMIPKGLALGIEQATPLAEESSQTLAKRIYDPFEGLEAPTMEIPMATVEASRTGNSEEILAAILEFLRLNWPDGEPAPIILDSGQTVGYYDRALGTRTRMARRGVV